MTNEIIIMALADEAPTMKSWSNVYFTGCGKVNAAMATAKILATNPQVKKVWNFGTAGGITVDPGLYRCSRFIQRDIDCRPLGVELGKTPFEDEAVIEFDTLGKTCSSGDNFVTDPAAPLLGDIVDMEAYAIAKVCKQFGVEFECWKYITDSADESSSTDWKDNVAKGEVHYVDIFHRA